MENIVKGIKMEITDQKRFSGHFRGAEDNPVQQPLMEEIMKDYMTDIEAKFAKLDAFGRLDSDRGKRVQACLESLHASAHRRARSSRKLSPR